MALYFTFDTLQYSDDAVFGVNTLTVKIFSHHHQCSYNTIRIDSPPVCLAQSPGYRLPQQLGRSLLRLWEQ